MAIRAMRYCLPSGQVNSASRSFCRQSLQQRTEQAYKSTLLQIKDLGFKCSTVKDIATKKDIASFLKIPQSTLNGFLSKHSYEIKPIRLSQEVIRFMGCKTSRMNGYLVEDVVKVVLGMDTEITSVIKKKILGDFGAFTKVSRSAI